MINIIEINYISPVTNYKFDMSKKSYYLTIIDSLGCIVYINKIGLSNIGNVNENIRSYYIGKSIQVYSSVENCSIKLFEYDSAINEIKLLFANSLKVCDLDYNKMENIFLYTPSPNINTLRCAKYINEISFLDEQFYNYETYDTDKGKENKCILFITKRRKATVPQISPYMFKFDESQDLFVYDRYSNNIIKEQKSYPVTAFCNSNTYDDYVKFVKLYNIDVNRYNYKDKDTFKSMFMRPINLKFRPLNCNPYMNNLVSSPVDGRIRALSFDAMNKEIDIYNCINKEEFKNGDGYISRLTFADYQRIYVPYQAFLKGIGFFNNNNSSCVILKFESTYFMPESVHEREYVSVIYGHETQQARFFPELMDVQPKITLIYYMFIMGDGDNSVVITNANLYNFKASMEPNKMYTIKSLWFDQAVELGVFNCCLGKVCCFFNRPVRYSSDIKLHSFDLSKKIECYVKARDIIGLLL